MASPVPGLPLTPPCKMGLEPRREKRESCITCRHMLGMTPFFPRNWAKNHIWKKIPYLSIVLLHWIHGDNVKGNYNAKFLEAIDLAFTLPLCLRRNNCKLFVQSLPVMMVLLNLQPGFGKCVCYMIVRLTCLRFSSIRVRC